MTEAIGVRIERCKMLFTVGAVLLPPVLGEGLGGGLHEYRDNLETTEAAVQLGGGTKVARNKRVGFTFWIERRRKGVRTRHGKPIC